MTEQSTPRPPGMTRFAQRGFARLAYEVSGEGRETVLLLHDLLGDRSTVAGFRDALMGAGFRVVAPDARGHGASAAVSGLRIAIAELVLDLLAILDALAVTRVHVVGVGLGAAIGFDLALVEPARVAGIVLIDPYLPGLLRDDADPEVSAAAARDHQESAKIADLAAKGSLDRALDLFFGPRLGLDWRTALPKARVAAMRRHGNAFGPLLNAVISYQPAAAPGATLPALILLGDDLPELDRLAAARLGALLTDARVEAPGDPIATAAAIVRFLLAPD